MDLCTLITKGHSQLCSWLCVMLTIGMCPSHKYCNKLTHIHVPCSLICRFTLIDLGGLGRHSDGGIFSHCGFGQDLEEGSLVLPNPSALPGTSSPDMPFVIVGDEAFPLRNYLMRPYPGRNLDGM